ncbi:MAG TPA: hypothetical protein PLI09_24470 [Candidatus Hydrogenedentes bacterium]|nr:hypothetical protein [Candidatus Hydrogenedentota bacterium]
MMLRSNNPDIAIAQEWVSELDTWIRTHGLCGYDPFDIKQARLLRMIQTSPFLRKTGTALCDLFPNGMRRILRVSPTENPKAHALTALGCLRLFELTQEQSFLDRALGHLDWLRQHASAGFHGLCWGYPFDVFGKGVDTPAGTPVGVISAIAGQAFLRAYELTKETAPLDDAQSIAQFMLQDLPRMDETDGACCFGYTPTDRRRVHNANLLVVEHLTRVGALTGDSAYTEAAEPALQFSLTHQREDGAWPYGEFAPGEPFERNLMELVDHHHTGFVLRALHGIYKVKNDERLYDALRKGFKFYQKLVDPGGIPLNEYGRYPVDIHACAECLLCCSIISESLAGAKNIAIRSMRWSWYSMRDPESGAVFYRKYPFHTTRIIFPRWGVAWMYWALAEYLHRFGK